MSAFLFGFVVGSSPSDAAQKRCKSLVRWSAVQPEKHEVMLSGQTR